MLNVDATAFAANITERRTSWIISCIPLTRTWIPELEAEFRKKDRGVKGRGNFKSMFINIPGGDKEGVKGDLSGIQVQKMSS